jgi:hypothetical protein
MDNDERPASFTGAGVIRWVKLNRRAINTPIRFQIKAVANMWEPWPT